MKKDISNSISREETAMYSRKSPEYQIGILQLKQWHERCRAKRLGIKYEVREITRFSIKNMKGKKK